MSDGSVELTGREPDEAEATRDQGQAPPTTSASTQSTSRDHPPDTETTTDPSRPSEDPADSTGDDERHPDEPTEPPDKPEGAGRRDGERSVEEVESRKAEVSRESREGVKGTGDVDDDGRGPGKLHEPSDDLPDTARGPAHVHVDPGGGIATDRTERAACENESGAGVDEVEGARQGVQVEAERSRTCRGDSIEGERPSALARGQSTTKADENDQHNEETIGDVPEGPPDPPPPPDEPIQQQNKTPSVELEGERKGVASSENALTGAKTGALEASGNVEDAGNCQTNTSDASERERGRSEPKVEDSPRRTPDAPDELDELGNETAVPGGVHDVQEHPRNVRSGCAEEMDAPCRDTAPGDPRGELEASRDVEGVWDRRNVVDSGGYDGIDPRTDGNERGIEMNTLGRDRGPGGHLGEQEAMGNVERDWRRRNVVGGDGYDGNEGWEDGVTSGARYDSKRVGTRSLAGQDSQHQHDTRNVKTDVPRPSQPPSHHHRRPIELADPPRRRGRLKSRPISVSNSRKTYQVIRARRSRIGRIGCAAYVVHGP